MLFVKVLNNTIYNMTKITSKMNCLDINCLQYVPVMLPEMLTLIFDSACQGFLASFWLDVSILLWANNITMLIVKV